MFLKLNGNAGVIKRVFFGSSKSFGSLPRTVKEVSRN